VIKLLTLFLAILSGPVLATTFITVNCGSWDDYHTWQGGNIGPLNGNSNVIVISACDAVILDNDIEFGNGCELNVAGCLVINGNLTAMNNLVINVSGSLTINGNINVKNDGELSVFGNVTVSGDVVFNNNGVIDMNSGYLDIGGNLSGGSGGNITGAGVIDIDGSNTFDITPPAGVTVNAGLPVSLIDFSAECVSDMVFLNWTTATEINSAYFLIQRSSDLSLWQDISQVSAAGNSNILLNYTHTDQQPLEGNNYYRIVQFDFDGGFEVFGPVSPDCSSGRMMTEIYPNPFTESLVISFQDIVMQSVMVILTDMKGRILLRYELSEDEVAQNMLTLHVNDIPAGIYFLTVSGDNFSESVKILKEADKGQ